jgi:molecular chaperone HscB
MPHAVAAVAAPSRRSRTGCKPVPRPQAAQADPDPNQWLAAAPPATFFVYESVCRQQLRYKGFAGRMNMTAPSTATHPPLVCWNCHLRTHGTHFCSACGKLLQLPQQVDYFALFEMPRNLWIEMSGLEKKFLELSWKLHPDKFVNASIEEQELSLKRSSELNDAYRVLRDPIARVEYLLGIEGMRKEGEHKQQAPPELLEEVFELNESLDELREAKASGDGLASIKERLESAEKNFQEKLGEVDAQLQETARQWDAAIDANGSDTARKAIMIRLNELLNRRSYIRNLVTNVQRELL